MADLLMVYFATELNCQKDTCIGIEELGKELGRLSLAATDDRRLQAIRPPVKRAIEYLQCYCATIMKWFGKNTEVAQVKLADINSELEEIKYEILNTHMDKRAVQNKIVGPLLSKMKRIGDLSDEISSLNKSQAFELHGILDKILAAVIELIKLIDNEQNPSEEVLVLYLNSLKQINTKIQEYDATYGKTAGEVAGLILGSCIVGCIYAFTGAAKLTAGAAIAAGVASGALVIGSVLIGGIVVPYVCNRFCEAPSIEGHEKKVEDAVEKIRKSS